MFIIFYWQILTKNNIYNVYNILYRNYNYYVLMKKFNKGVNILINIQ
jgi:hypothetical protein